MLCVWREWCTHKHIWVCVPAGSEGKLKLSRGLNGLADTPDTLCLPFSGAVTASTCSEPASHVINKTSSGRNACKALHWSRNLPSPECLCAWNYFSLVMCRIFKKWNVSKIVKWTWRFFDIYFILFLGFCTWVVYLDLSHSTISPFLLLCTHLTPSQVHDLLFSNYYCYVCVRVYVIQSDGSFSGEVLADMYVHLTLFSSYLSPLGHHKLM